MIIRKNDEFTNENGQLVIITSAHFNDYAVSIYQYNDESESYIWDYDTIYTEYEVRRLTGAKSITWEE